jgi:hypothetical protein
MKKTVIILTIALLFILASCSSKSSVDYQPKLDEAVSLVNSEQWKSALEAIKEIPDSFHADVEPLKHYINAQISLTDSPGMSNFERNKSALHEIESIDLSEANDDITSKITTLTETLQIEVDQVLEEARAEEQQKVSEAAKIIKETYTIELDREEEEAMLEEVRKLVGDYDSFRTEYKEGAHILYLNTITIKLINSYRENQTPDDAEDNYAAYGNKFADEHRTLIVSHIKDIDPTKRGHGLPEYIMRNIKTGMKNFFHISESKWVEIYNDKSVDWVEIAEDESKRNEQLREISPQVGMTAEEVIKTKWGQPQRINKTTTAYGVTEQWVYSGYRYVYLENGVVDAVQQ